MSQSEAVQDLARGNVHFAFGLFKRLALDDKERNFAFSPFVVTAALSGILESAREMTATQLKEVLHVDENTKLPHHLQAVREILQTIAEKKERSDAIVVENLLLVPSDNKIVESFEQTCAHFCELGVVAFGDDADLRSASALRRDLVDKATALDTTGQLLLASAIEYHSIWGIGFNPESTVPTCFYSHGGTKKMMVPMMHRKGVFNFAVMCKPSCRMIEIPLSGRAVSLFLIMTPEIDGLAALEERMTSDTLQKLLNSMVEAPILLALPKFRLVMGDTLDGPLAQLGAGNIFTPGNAKFEGICEKSGLTVSKIYHEVMMNVCEEGTLHPTARDKANLTKAPCVTSVNEYFIADHPFIYFVKDLELNVILIMGRMQCPPQSD